MNGHKVTTSGVVVKEGESVTFTQENANGKSYIEVVATDEAVQDRQAILMKFVVGLIDKEGKKTVVSRPQIIAGDNELAEIAVGKTGDKDAISLSVLARRN